MSNEHNTNNLNILSETANAFYFVFCFYFTLIFFASFACFFYIEINSSIQDPTHIRRFIISSIINPSIAISCYAIPLLTTLEVINKIYINRKTVYIKGVVHTSKNPACKHKQNDEELTTNKNQ